MSPAPQNPQDQTQYRNPAQQKPPVISNKLSLEEALIHRRSLLTASVLLKEDKRSHDTDAALHMLLCSLRYRQVDEDVLRQTRLADVVRPICQHPHRPAADLALGLLHQPLWASFAQRQPPLQLI